MSHPFPAHAADTIKPVALTRWREPDRRSTGRIPANCHCESWKARKIVNNSTKGRAETWGKLAALSATCWKNPQAKSFIFCKAIISGRLINDFHMDVAPSCIYLRVESHEKSPWLCSLTMSFFYHPSAKSGRRQWKTPHILHFRILGEERGANEKPQSPSGPPFRDNNGTVGIVSTSDSFRSSVGHVWGQGGDKKGPTLSLLVSCP